nr:MAG TPA_asm: hypothetical protein [Caudoviricetes sp.]
MIDHSAGFAIMLSTDYNNNDCLQRYNRPYL